MTSYSPNINQTPPKTYKILEINAGIDTHELHILPDILFIRKGKEMVISWLCFYIDFFVRVKEI